jgi:hypothetical protein
MEEEVIVIFNCQVCGNELILDPITAKETPPHCCGELMTKEE